MSYIFLDENGDLGFNFNKKKTTKYFLITLLLVKNKRPIEKLVRNIHKGLRKKYKMRDGMLHACKEEPITCLRFYKKVITKDCQVMVIYLNKKKVYAKLRNQKTFLYNYVVNILLDRIITKRLINKNENIILIASRRETNKFLNLNFKSYLEKQTKNNHKLNINIQIKTPFEEKSLQAVDMLSWALFRKYEYRDDSYYNILKAKDLIIEENPLFP